MKTDKFYICSGNEKQIISAVDTSTALGIYISSLFKKYLSSADEESNSFVVDLRNMQAASAIAVSNVGFFSKENRENICGEDKEEQKIYDAMHADDLILDFKQCISTYVKFLKMQNVNIKFANSEMENDREF